MSRERSSENGISQWKMKSRVMMMPQCPRMRSRYQRNLFRQVAGPDDEELAEGEVDIQHHEGEGELAEVVLLGLAQNGLEGLGLGEADEVSDRERETGISLADEEQQSIDRGEPGDVHRHDPVDDGGGHGERVDDDAGAADVFELLDPAGRGVGRFKIALQASELSRQV